MNGVVVYGMGDNGMLKGTWGERQRTRRPLNVSIDGQVETLFGRDGLGMHSPCSAFPYFVPQRLIKCDQILSNERFMPVGAQALRFFKPVNKVVASYQPAAP